MSDAQLRDLLEYLREGRGFDFTAYKPSTVGRRLQKRMRDLKIEGYGDYIEYLEVHPDEFVHLFNAVLINVTSFLRDAATWQYLAEHVVPDILKDRPSGPIRVWSAGCASGEEPYSLVMLFAEALGDEGFRERVKVYATDIDEEALAEARAGSYPESKVRPLSTELRERYFEPAGGRLVFRKDLRRCLIFGRHDLLRDAPISRIDLLACRNTLMYFNAEAQRRIAARFHFALNPDGYLLLGKAEMLFAQHDSFTPLDLKRRVFTKLPDSGSLRERLRLIEGGSRRDAPPLPARELRLREAAFEGGPSAQIVIDDAGFLVLANERARSLFGLDVRHLGRLLQDLELSYRPLELRSLLTRAAEEKARVALPEVEWRLGQELHYFDVEISPLAGTNGGVLGFNVTFTDRTEPHQLREQVQQSTEELETAYEELQSANEELETTNEELHSTVEELEATNEELQSASEELETMNEELQSTNEELRAINDQLQERTEEAARASTFLRSVLTSLSAGVVVLDRKLRVQVWSDKVEELWGLRAGEVRHQPFFGLDIGLPVERLRQPVRACLDGASSPQETVLSAVNRRGRTIHCRVIATPQLVDGGKTDGVILLMEEDAGAHPEATDGGIPA